LFVLNIKIIFVFNTISSFILMNIVSIVVLIFMDFAIY